MYLVWFPFVIFSTLVKDMENYVNVTMIQETFSSQRNNSEWNSDNNLYLHMIKYRVMFRKEKSIFSFYIFFPL